MHIVRESPAAKLQIVGHLKSIPADWSDGFKFWHRCVHQYIGDDPNSAKSSLSGVLPSGKTVSNRIRPICPGDNASRAGVP